MGKVIGLATQEKETGDMIVCAHANVSFTNGLGDQYENEDEGERLITIMTLENWNALCGELDRKLHWTMRKANIIIEGIDLENTKDEYLMIGDFYLQIIGENVPGKDMDDQFLGLTKALTPNWKGGVVCKIIREGAVNENDQVVFVEKE